MRACVRVYHRLQEPRVVGPNRLVEQRAQLAPAGRTAGRAAGAEELV